MVAASYSISLHAPIASLAFPDAPGELPMPRILAVDDSPSMRQMVSATLTSAGYEVEEAEDGVQALQLAGRQRFDLVITDVNMPNMDGITLVRELRGKPNYKFVPLLILTTEATSERKMQGKNAGATGWLVKPFNPDRLLATIQKVLV
jgi:two-component system chemotaxis response regulator CheY